MPGKPRIKWRKSDAEKLDREVKRFNAKIYRTRQRHPELTDILPKPILKADKARLIQDLQEKPRSEFNKEVKSLARFIKPGAEQAITSKTGNTVTRWEKNEVSLKVAQVNRQRAAIRKEMSNLDATSRGEPLGLKRGEMGSERMNALKPKHFHFDKIRPGREWELFKESVLRQADPEERLKSAEQYKANYIEAMENAYGEYGRDIIDLIKGLPAETVVKTYYQEQEATIKFHYELTEMNAKLEILRGIWGGVVKGELQKELNAPVHG